MKSILVIDGSIEIAEPVIGLFENRGWTVIACGDLNIAMNRMAGSESFSVVLINYLVPADEALKFIRFTRMLDHRRTIAIVMVASNAREAEDGRWAGADRVLVSPVNTAGLIHVVEEQAK